MPPAFLVSVQAQLLKLKLQTQSAAGGSGGSGASGAGVPASVSQAMSGMFPQLKETLQAFGAMTEAQ